MLGEFGSVLENIVHHVTSQGYKVDLVGHSLGGTLVIQAVQQGLVTTANRNVLPIAISPILGRAWAGTFPRIVSSGFIPKLEWGGLMPLLNGIGANSKWASALMIYAAQAAVHCGTGNYPYVFANLDRFAEDYSLFKWRPWSQVERSVYVKSIEQINPLVDFPGVYAASPADRISRVPGHLMKYFLGAPCYVGSTFFFDITDLTKDPSKHNPDNWEVVRKEIHHSLRENSSRF